jgi:hypothetical protein
MPHAHQALGWRGRRGIAPDGGAARGREVRSARSRSGLVGATRRGRGRRPGPRRRATGDRRGTAPRGPAGSGHPGQPPGPATSATDGQRSHSWADTRQRACQSETQRLSAVRIGVDGRSGRRVRGVGHAHTFEMHRAGAHSHPAHRGVEPRRLLTCWRRGTGLRPQTEAPPTGTAKRAP